MNQLREELGISELDATGGSPVPTLEAETVRQLQAQLITTKTQLAREETQLKELEKMTSDQRRDAIQTVLGQDSELGTLLSEHNLSQQKLLAVGKDYSQEHPEYRTAKVMADETAKRINQRMDGIMIGMTTRVSGLRSTVENLDHELHKTRATDLEKSERCRPYYEAKRQLEELARFRSVLSLKLASEKVDRSLPKSTLVEIIDRAEPALRPVRPNKPFNLFLGAVVGVLLGSIAGGVAAWGKGRVRPNTSPAQVTSA